MVPMIGSISGKTAVTMVRTGFASSGTLCEFDSVAAEVTFVSSKEIICISPSILGPADVRSSIHKWC